MVEISSLCLVGNLIALPSRPSSILHMFLSVSAFLAQIDLSVVIGPPSPVQPLHPSSCFPPTPPARDSSPIVVMVSDVNQEEVIEEQRILSLESNEGNLGEDATIFNGKEIDITEKTGRDRKPEITVKTTRMGFEKKDWTQDFSLARKPPFLDEEGCKQEMKNSDSEMVLSLKVDSLQQHRPGGCLQNTCYMQHL